MILIENESPGNSDLGSSVILHKNQSISTQQNRAADKQRVSATYVNPPDIASGAPDSQGNRRLVDSIEAVRAVNSRMDEL